MRTRLENRTGKQIRQQTFRALLYIFLYNKRHPNFSQKRLEERISRRKLKYNM